MGCSAGARTDKPLPPQGKPCLMPVFGLSRGQAVHSFFYFVKLTPDQANQGTCYSKTLTKNIKQLILLIYFKL